jgi:hypothetical protein
MTRKMQPSCRPTCKLSVWLCPNSSSATMSKANGRCKVDLANVRCLTEERQSVLDDTRPFNWGKILTVCAVPHEGAHFYYEKGVITLNH